MAQFECVLVDKTTFADLESGVTESDFNSAATRKFFGMNHGVSDAFTSGTISKAGRLISSGVFQITLKGTENNYDRMHIRISHPSAAVQIIPWENVDNDDSDLMSALTVIQSMASDAASAAVQANSRVILVQSRLSDLDSRLVSDVSNIASAIADNMAYHLINNSRINDTHSLLSDMFSDFQSRVPKLVATNSQLSDLVSDAISDLRSFIGAGVELGASTMSDLRSAINAGPAATVTASDISDIASAVGDILASRLSDILSAAVQTNSRVLLNQSRVSDIYSLLSDFQSDLISHLDVTGVGLNASTMSDLRSAIDAGPAATVTASDISDIASAVRALLVSDLSDILSAAVQTNSRVLLNQSRISDVYSLLSDYVSDFGSRIPKEPAARSQLSDLVSDVVSDLRSFIGAGVELGASTLSDIRSAITAGPTDVQLNASSLSDLRSAITAITATVSASDISDIASAVKATLASDLSDILSAAVQANSRVLLNQSRISDVYSALSDFQSDFGSRIPKEPAARSQLSGLVSDAVSDLRSFIGAGVELGASSLSDLRSAIAAAELGASTMSDLRSAINALSPTLTASDISDIASAVKVILASDLSDILSAAVQTNSRALVSQSRVSDIYSLLSDLDSNFQSRVPKETAARSQLSDIASDVVSDLKSFVGAGVELGASTLSDLRSAITAGPTDVQLNASSLSDLRSAITAGPTDVQLNASSLSDLRSAILAGPTDVQLNASSLSDLRSAITAAEFDASDISDVASAVRAIVASDLSDILSSVTAIAADLPTRITKNVALANFEFVLVQSADHYTPATGASVTAQRSIDGGAFAACANAATEVGSGVYKIDLAAADLNGNVVTLKFSAAATDTRLITIVTQPT